MLHEVITPLQSYTFVKIFNFVTSCNVNILFMLWRQVLREGMGQQANRRHTDVLDTVITNALIVDAVTGIIKADVGIKVWGISSDD